MVAVGLVESGPETKAASMEASAADSTAVDTLEVVAAYSPPRYTNEDVLWLARCAYSETKRPEEQELVAWVVRNRVETEFRGVTTVEGVVLDPFQFSAFNPNTDSRLHYSALDTMHTFEGWQDALQIARRVLEANPVDRPFHVETRHFYSERSMAAAIRGVGPIQPRWAEKHKQVAVNDRRVDERRFRFYRGIL